MTRQGLKEQYPPVSIGSTLQVPGLTAVSRPRLLVVSFDVGIRSRFLPL